MKSINDKSVRLILCDLPFEMTQNEWDRKIPLEPLWNEYKRIIMDNGAILLFSKGVFTAELILSNKDMYRYKYTWVKNRATGHLNVNRMPMQATEDILVFYKNQPVYNPQKTEGHKPVNNFYTRHTGSNYGKADNCSSGGGSTERYPTDVLFYSVVNKPLHPTEKPVELLEFLIKTYSNEDDLVLDNCSGSGSLAEACMKTNRRFFCIEQDEEIYQKSVIRICKLPAV
jgi:site-specific DNA-methyltransferase (adenine-specific)